MTKMSNAPIFYALAQVRFNAVLALDQYLPTIQEGLRRAGFPDFERGSLTLLSFTPGAQPQQATPQPHYNFFNQDRTAGFIIDQAMVLFQTTAYGTFGGFSDEFLKGAEIVHRACDLSYSDRVGIRYLDAVCPKEGESINQYLVDGVRGIYDLLAPRSLVHSYYEARTKSGSTTLVSRAVIINQESAGPVQFPSDLTAPNMTLGERFRELRGLYGLIDTDSWLEEREQFDIAGLGRRLTALHSDLRRSFNLMVTPFALESWQ